MGSDPPDLAAAVAAIHAAAAAGGVIRTLKAIQEYERYYFCEEDVCSILAEELEFGSFDTVMPSRRFTGEWLYVFRVGVDWEAEDIVVHELYVKVAISIDPLQVTLLSFKRWGSPE